MHDILDKGKAAIIVIRSEMRDKATRKLKAVCYMSLLIRGIGGSGRNGFYKVDIPRKPKQPATVILEEQNDPNQAFLYRLTGDTNPHCVDPKLAQSGGLKRPILQGLCTYSVTARVVYEQFFKGNAGLMKEMTAQFVSYVYPGDTFII